MINLTDEEYRKFALWCRQEADSYEAITSQMEKVGPAMEIVAEINRSKMLAYRFVADHLDSTERSTIGGNRDG
jgi:hypothetical protein